jgi:DNA-binding PadR family transcriptional regulator
VPALPARGKIVDESEFGMRNSDDKQCGPPWSWKRKGKHGPPWMRGGPFGPGFAFGPTGFGGARPGRMFGQGELQLLLLALIADQPAHGYDLIRTIEAKFKGSYAPSPGTIYPTLTLLEEQELVTGTAEAGGKKSYAATLAGRQHLAERGAEVKALMARIDIMAGAQEDGVPPPSVMQAVKSLRHAILANSSSWTEAEEKRVREILERAAREILSGKG